MDLDSEAFNLRDHNKPAVKPFDIFMIHSKPDLHKAGRAGFGAWIGLLFGAAAKLALAFLMVGVFLTALMI